MASAANPAFIDRFLTFINQHCEIDVPSLSPARPVLLAVSGGIDSVVMAHLFGLAKLPFAVAHVNFGLRDAESDEDQQFVEQLADQYGAPFHTVRFPTEQLAAEQGVSIQMVARSLRYDWFEQVRAVQQYTAIATAHHQNDVLETVLLNLTRGTGLAGLHGIAARQGHIIRPLLFADRAEITAFAAEHNLTWREDRSNAHDDYARNRIRHQVVPVLQSLNPNLLTTFSTTVERLRAAETLVRESLEQTATVVLKTDGGQTTIDLVTLRTLSEPRFRLAEWLRPFGFSYGQATAVWQAIGQGTGQEFGSATHRLIHERDRLTLWPFGAATEPVELPFILIEPLPEQITLSARQRFRLEMMNKPACFAPPTDPKTACFDADRLTFPLTIRHWRAGDRFRPLGLNGSKLVSDLLADERVPRLEREETLVLESGNEIAWVMGRRLDHRFRVTDRTTRILRIQPLGEV